MSKKKRRTTGAPEPRPAPVQAPKADKFRFRLASPWAVPAILALLTLLYFYDFPLSGQVIYGSDTGTDFHRGEEPFAEKLATYGPGVWKPTLGGYPASEEIRPDYFPASLLKLFTTHQRHLGWRFMLTVFFAGWGMYRYLRVLDLARWPCLWGGVAFMFAPTFLSFTFAGHYAKMAVIALLPWMYLCLHRGMQEGKLSRFLGLALLIGLGVYTPHVQMLQYALIAVGLYFLFQLYLLYRERREKRVLLARTGLFALAVALGVGIGSEGLFPPTCTPPGSRSGPRRRPPKEPGTSWPWRAAGPCTPRRSGPCWSRSSPASTTPGTTATSTGAAIPASTTPSTSASSCCCWPFPPCGRGGATPPRPSWVCFSPSPSPSRSEGTPPCTGSPPTCCRAARCCAPSAWPPSCSPFPPSCSPPPA